MAPAPAPRTDVGPPGPSRAALERRLLELLPFIERTVRGCARRYRLDAVEAAELEGKIKVRLLEDDCAVLRKFRGTSRLTTYLTKVILNLTLDHMRRGGRWRPSAAAMRRGGLAVELEELVHRDGYSLDEAHRVLDDRHPGAVRLSELEAIAAELRPRRRVRVLRMEDPPELAVHETGELRLIAAERRRQWAEMLRALGGVLDELDHPDRQLIRLRYEEGLTVRSIAERIGERPRTLYGRFQSLLGRLRVRLEQAGLSQALIAEGLGGGRAA